MNRSEVEAIVRGIIDAYAEGEPKDVDLNWVLQEHYLLDSLDITEILMKTEEQFGVDLSEADNKSIPGLTTGSQPNFYLTGNIIVDAVCNALNIPANPVAANA